MERLHTKEAAEALLRELPSVLGAFVREDVNGHPREIHLLVGPSPNVKLLAQDVRDLLEERLEIPIDQRVISIAQLAEDVSDFDARVAAPAAGGQAAEARLRFVSADVEIREQRVRVRTVLTNENVTHEGEAAEVDAGAGRLRAGAVATLRAASAASRQHVRLELDAVSLIRAFDRDYVLVAVLAGAPALGRRPLQLAGAHAMEEDPETAACLATLKAINRILARILAF